MASYKDYKSVSAAKKAGSMYFMGKDGKKKLAVTKEELDSWKKRNKGKFKGSALTAWANAKGKDIGGMKSSPRPKLRPDNSRPEIETTILPPAKGSTQGKATVKEIKDMAESALSRADKTKKDYESKVKARNQERGPTAGQAFNAWYEKNGSKYGTMKEAMDAWKSSRSGNSKGGMAKKKSGYKKGGLVDMRKTGLFR